MSITQKTAAQITRSEDIVDIANAIIGENRNTKQDVADIT
jgi:hypothetical protein